MVKFRLSDLPAMAEIVLFGKLQYWPPVEMKAFKYPPDATNAEDRKVIAVPATRDTDPPVLTLKLFPFPPAVMVWVAP